MPGGLCNVRQACVAIRGKKEKDAYRELWLRFRTWCAGNRYGSASGPGFSRASLGRNTRTSYPELSLHFKAAVVKLLIMWVASESMQIDLDPTRRLHAWALAEWVMLLSNADMWLTSEERRRAYELGRIYLLAHARLAKRHLAVDAQQRPAALFFVRPKHHCFDHMASPPLPKTTPMQAHISGSWPLPKRTA